MLFSFTLLLPRSSPFLRLRSGGDDERLERWLIWGKVSHWEKRRLLCSGDIPAETQMMGRNQVCWESEVLKPELEVAWHLGRIRITSISKAEGLEQWLGQHINWDRWSGPDIIELCRPQKGIWFFFSATYEKVWGDFRHRSDKTWWTFVKYQSCDYMDVKEQWTQEE